MRRLGRHAGDVYEKPPRQAH